MKRHQNWGTLLHFDIQERETAAAALTGHRRVNGCERTKRAAPGGRPDEGASTEKPVAHLRRLHHHARANQRGWEAEYCRPRVTHTPIV